jgi:hypothetical protein
VVCPILTRLNLLARSDATLLPRRPLNKIVFCYHMFLRPEEKRKVEGTPMAKQYASV